MNNLHNFPLLTAQEIANSPTIKEGWTTAREASIRKRAASNIFNTAKDHKYRMSAATASFAVTFFVRYYTRKSMQKNHPFLIALASLFLAGKVNDDPRSLDSMVYFMLITWYGQDNPELQEKLQDIKFLHCLRDAAIDAELSILLTLGFDFNIGSLHATTWHFVKDIPLLAELRSKKSKQHVINFCNDVMKLDPTLVLQYSIPNIGLAVIQFYFKWLKEIKQPPDDAVTGAPWYEAYGLPTEIYKEISGRLKGFYNLLAEGTSKTTTTMAAESTMSGATTGTVAAGGAVSSARAGARSTAAAVIGPRQRVPVASSSLSSYAASLPPGAANRSSSPTKRRRSNTPDYYPMHLVDERKEDEDGHGGKESDLEEGELEEGELPPED